MRTAVKKISTIILVICIMLCTVLNASAITKDICRVNFFVLKEEGFIQSDSYDEVNTFIDDGETYYRAYDFARLYGKDISIDIKGTYLNSDSALRIFVPTTITLMFNENTYFVLKRGVNIKKGSTYSTIAVAEPSGAYRIVEDSLYLSKNAVEAIFPVNVEGDSISVFSVEEVPKFLSQISDDVIDYFILSLFRLHGKYQDGYKLVMDIGRAKQYIIASKEYVNSKLSCNCNNHPVASVGKHNRVYFSDDIRFSYIENLASYMVHEAVHQSGDCTESTSVLEGNKVLYYLGETKDSLLRTAEYKAKTDEFIYRRGWRMTVNWLKDLP